MAPVRHLNTYKTVSINYDAAAEKKRTMSDGRFMPHEKT